MGGDTLLSEMDEDVGRAIEAALIDEGIEAVTDVQLLRVTRETTGIAVWAMKDGRERSYVGQEVLQALGRQPNIEGLRLDLTEVTIDGAMRTSQTHIYAVGDVAAYNATHADRPAKTIDHRLDTEVVCTDPQVAVLGLNEVRAKADFPLSLPPILSPTMEKHCLAAQRRGL